MNFEVGTISSAEARKAASRWQPSRAKLRTRLHLCLLALDSLCIFTGFLIAGLIYKPGSDPQQWLLAATVITPIYVGAALNAHAYSAGVIQEPGRGILRSLKAFALAAGVVILVAFYLKTSDSLSRVTMALGTSFSVVLLAVARDVFLRKARGLLGGDPYHVVLITDGEQPVATAGFSTVIAGNGIGTSSESLPVMYDRLATALQDADRVVVACAPERRQSWARILKGAGIRSEILAPELQTLAPLGQYYWRGSPTLVVAEGPLSTFDRILKRSFDIVVAGTVLLLLAPLLLISALIIKLESPGPALFVQTRIGLGNRMFKMLKFRSMRMSACDSDGAASTQRDDDRITRFGRLIRSTSIDELPQLVNVLLGDMSIVGPRPHALGSRAEDKLFWEIDERYWHRHAAKPGLTGLAQVRGYRGATMRESDLTDRLQSDLEYLNDWSIWRDFKILLMTFGVLVHKNAY